MKNEAEFKKAFKNSVKAQSGYSISLAAPMLPGIPDLYVIMPNYMPVLIEAKWLGNIGDRFRRKLALTEMQKMYLDECCKIHSKSALILVGYRQYGEYWATLKLRTIGQDEYEDGRSGLTCKFDKKLCDVGFMFDSLDVPKIKMYGQYRDGIIHPVKNFTLQALTSVV